MVRKEIKQLQCLYAWSDFYTKNEQHENIYKIQQQIKEHKEKFKLK